MKYVDLIEDVEIGKVEMWELKNETAEMWNERKDDMIQSSDKKIILEPLFTACSQTL